MLKSSPDLLAKIGFTLQKQDETGSVILDLLATRPDCRENGFFYKYQIQEPEDKNTPSLCLVAGFNPSKK